MKSTATANRSVKKKAPASAALPAPVHYRIEAFNPHAHLWRVTLSIAQPARQQTVSLPVWIPGSYMVREFSKHLSNLQVQQNGAVLEPQQLDKCTWRIACATGQSLKISYDIYAFDPSVRTAWLDAQRGFFNPTSLCLRVHGQEELAHSLSLDAMNSVALNAVSTSARAIKGIKKPLADKLGNYVFDGYDELADTPFEIGNFWRGSFKVRGVAHELTVSGAWPSFDSERLLADTKKIVETAMAFWHGANAKPPFDRYVFMLHAVDDGYGGLEHAHSTALICSRRDLPRLGHTKPLEGYTTLLGLISHEYFHTWNVKRLKPQEFVRLDYTQENYTRMLWFFEGFTSYYDDLLLHRAGLIDTAQYLRLLAKTATQVQQTPGRKTQSVAQASMDAWVKYYRPDENTPNATVSYYAKGALVALCFDLSLRQGGAKQRKTSLDEVMRWLWTHAQASEKSQGGITQADFTTALRILSGRSYAPEIAAWIHANDELPLQLLLAAHGCNATPESSTSLPMAQRLGLRIVETGGNVVVKTVLHGGLAQAAGVAAGDEWLAVDAWRIRKLDDLSLLAGRQDQVMLTLSRDQRVLQVPLDLAPLKNQASSSWQFHCTQAETLNAWLQG